MQGWIMERAGIPPIHSAARAVTFDTYVTVHARLGGGGACTPILRLLPFFYIAYSISKNH